jgi:hypothetical protein
MLYVLFATMTFCALAPLQEVQVNVNTLSGAIIPITDVTLTGGLSCFDLKRLLEDHLQVPSSFMTILQGNHVLENDHVFTHADDNDVTVTVISGEQFEVKARLYNRDMFGRTVQGVFPSRMTLKDVLEQLYRKVGGGDFLKSIRKIHGI